MSKHEEPKCRICDHRFRETGVQSRLDGVLLVTFIDQERKLLIHEDEGNFRNVLVPACMWCCTRLKAS